MLHTRIDVDENDSSLSFNQQTNSSSSSGDDDKEEEVEEEEEEDIFKRIPREVSILILSFLTPVECAIVFGNASKHCLSLSRMDEIWYKYYQRVFLHPLSRSNQRGESSRYLSAYQLFIRKYFTKILKSSCEKTLVNAPRRDISIDNEPSAMLSLSPSMIFVGFKNGLLRVIDAKTSRSVIEVDIVELVIAHINEKEYRKKHEELNKNFTMFNQNFDTWSGPSSPRSSKSPIYLMGTTTTTIPLSSSPVLVVTNSPIESFGNTITTSTSTTTTTTTTTKKSRSQIRREEKLILQSEKTLQKKNSVNDQIPNSSGTSATFTQAINIPLGRRAQRAKKRREYDEQQQQQQQQQQQATDITVLDHNIANDVDSLNNDNNSSSNHNNHNHDEISKSESSNSKVTFSNFGSYVQKLRIASNMSTTSSSSDGTSTSSAYVQLKKSNPSMITSLIHESPKKRSVRFFFRAIASLTSEIYGVLLFDNNSLAALHMELFQSGDVRVQNVFDLNLPSWVDTPQLSSKKNGVFSSSSSSSGHFVEGVFIGSKKNHFALARSNGTIQIWNISDGSFLDLISIPSDENPGRLGKIKAMCVSQDGKSLFVSDESGNVHNINCETKNDRTKLVTLNCKTSSPVCILRANSDVVVGGCVDGSLYIWRRCRSTLIAYFQAHSRSITALELAPWGENESVMIFSGGQDGLCRVWNVSLEASIKDEISFMNKPTAVAALKRRSSTISNREVIEELLRDVEKSTSLVTLLPLKSKIKETAVYSLPKKKLGEGSIKTLSSGHQEPILHIVVDTNKLTVAAEDGSIKLWDLRSAHFGQVLRSFKGIQGGRFPVSKLSVANREVFAAYSNGEIYRFHFDDQKIGISSLMNLNGKGKTSTLDSSSSQKRNQRKSDNTKRKPTTSSSSSSSSVAAAISGSSSSTRKTPAYFIQDDFFGFEDDDFFDDDDDQDIVKQQIRLSKSLSGNGARGFYY